MVRLHIVLFLTTMVLSCSAYRVSNQGTSVNCGGHQAQTCSACTRGNGKSWCNGDCRWSGNACVERNRGAEPNQQCATGLIRLVNAERRKRSLPQLKQDDCLCRVADMHAKDSQQYYDQGGQFDDNNNMHSWSSITPKGFRTTPWRPCSYDSNHNNMKCMHNKPKELCSGRDIPRQAFEISHGRFGGTGRGMEKSALEGWLRSPGHSDVMLSKGIWESQNFSIVGAQCSKNFCHMWFK